MLVKIALGVATTAAAIGGYCLWRTRNIRKLEQGYFYDKKTDSWKRGLDTQHESEMEAFNAGMEAQTRVDKAVTEVRKKEYVLSKQFDAAQVHAKETGVAMTIEEFLKERDRGAYDDIAKTAEAAFSENPDIHVKEKEAEFLANKSAS